MATLSYRNTATLQLLISQQLARNMLPAVGPGSEPADGRLTVRVPVVALITLARNPVPTLGMLSTVPVIA